MHDAKGRWLDFLASVRGFVATMIAVVIFGLAIVHWVNDSTEGLRNTASEMDVFSSSRVHAALNDILRITTKLQERSDEDWDEEAREAFQYSLDHLYNRAQHMETRLDEIAELESDQGTLEYRQTLRENGDRAILSIWKLIDAGDQALAAPDVASGLEDGDFVSLTEIASRDVFRYLDHMTKVQSELSQQQGNKISTLSFMVLSFILLVGVGVGVGLILLRMEVRARQLRNQAESRAWQLAYFDQVTGLPNRAQFTEVVEAALERQQECSLVLLDLDYFKDVNDRYGHIIGDRVLKEFASRVQNECRENDALAVRLGGDEFAIFLETDNLRFLRRFLDTLQELCRVPMQFNGATIIAGFSAGMAASTQISVTRKVRLEEFIRRQLR